MDGTIAKAEWSALSIQTPFFKYFDAEGDVMDALTPIETSEGCVGALLNFSERHRTEEIYVTLTLLKEGSASLGGAHALGIFVSSQSVEVRDTHCRSAYGRGMTSMWMPRNSSLPEDLFLWLPGCSTIIINSVALDRPVTCFLCA